MTKAETTILRRVQEVNDRGGLKGLCTDPHASNFTAHEHRFVKRLYEAGEILWVDYNPKLGAGWILKGRNPLNPIENIVSRA
jgi:hypothetical protein